MKTEPMPSRNHKAALIGLGNIAWKYDADFDANAPARSQGGAVRKHGGLVLAGGCSPEPADRAGFSAWAPGAEVCHGAEEMLAELQPEVVGICSPTSEHFNQALLCLEAGVKALWLEKPPTENPDELDRLIVRAKEKGAAVCVNYTRRYLPVYARLRELLQSRAYGPCRLIRLLYSPGLARNGVHLLDQLFYLTAADDYHLLWVEEGGGASPCFALRLSTGQLVEGAGGDWPYHTNDLSMVCDGGTLSVLRGGKTARAERRVENDLFPGFYDLKDDPGEPLGTPVFEGYMEAALADLMSCLKNGGQPRSNLESARLSQRLLDDILRGAGE